MPSNKLNNPTAAANNWSSRTAASQTRYKDGISSVTENPMDKAAAKADTWFSRVQEAHANNRFANSLAGRNINDWKTPAMDKGATNYVTGATAGKSKYAAFATDFFPFLAQQQAAVKQMPNATKDQRKARMNEMFDRVGGYTYRRKGS